MKGNTTFDENKPEEHGSKHVVFGKRLLCITESSDILGLEKSFSDIQIIKNVEYLEQLHSVPCEACPDAVIFFASEINNKFFNELRFVGHIVKRCSIPLIVINNTTDKELKKNILKNGADDCFTHKLNAEGLNYWIDFLKLFKKLAKEKPTQQIEPFEFKISFLKRLFDISVSLTVLFLLSPLMLLIALIVKLESKGPVFYVSKRAGRGYKVFNFIKFRSMAQGADRDLNKLMHLNQYGESTEAAEDKSTSPVFFKIKDDPRITRFGRFIRNTSLDEIPQLINVLKGDMSIVGNRPLPLYEAQQLAKDQCAMRFMAAAGITGLWQVTKRGRSNMSDNERIALDVDYAKNNSFLYDMSLIFKTVPALFQEEKV